MLTGLKIPIQSGK